MHLKQSFKSIAFGYILYKEGNALPPTNIAFGDVTVIDLKLCFKCINLNIAFGDVRRRLIDCLRLYNT